MGKIPTIDDSATNHERPAIGHESDAAHQLRDNAGRGSVMNLIRELPAAVTRDEDAGLRVP